MSPLNFLDPLLTSDADKYCGERYKELARGRYLISKHSNTSYADTKDITPTEREYLIEFITEDLKVQQKIIDELPKR